MNGKGQVVAGLDADPSSSMGKFDGAKPFGRAYTYNSCEKSGSIREMSVSSRDDQLLPDDAHVKGVRLDTPLGYLYGVRFVGEITPLVEAIREVR
jgi:hypothetical protein